MSKSSCCGADISVESPTGDYLQNFCESCNCYCEELPKDIMSMKEIVEFCDKWDGELKYRAEKVENVKAIFADFEEEKYLILKDMTRYNITEWSNVRDFLKDLEQFLKSVKHHMGER